MNLVAGKPVGGAKAGGNPSPQFALQSRQPRTLRRCRRNFDTGQIVQ